MTDLLTFQEYVDLSGKNISDLTDEDALRTANAITAASNAVRSFTDRYLVLASEATVGPREYRYRGHGTLDIDDCTTINSISTKAEPWAVSRTLDPSEWFALKEVLPVYDYVELYTRFLASGQSPQMGFKRNLDNYPFTPYPTVVVVDAVWGWPEIPAQIKQATLWTADMFLTDPGEPYTNESIAGYSRSYSQARLAGGLTPGAITQALPDRAIALLDPFLRWTI
jgi:hypothetical protein